MILAGESHAPVSNARIDKAAHVVALNGCMILLKPIPGECSRLVGTDSKLPITPALRPQARKLDIHLPPLRTAIPLRPAVNPSPIRQRHPPRVHQMRAVLCAISINHDLVAQLDVALLEP